MSDANITTKTGRIVGLLASGDDRGAVLAAAKMPILGRHRDAILSAREAYLRPDFQRQIGRDCGALIEAGVAAVRDRFCHAGD